MSKEQRFIKKLGLEIRSLRNEQELSQMALAAESGLDKTYIGLLERAEVNPTIGTLLKISDALNVDLIVEFREKKTR